MTATVSGTQSKGREVMWRTPSLNSRCKYRPLGGRYGGVESHSCVQGGAAQCIVCRGVHGALSEQVMSAGICYGSE